jgi:Glycosyltransferase family 87
MRLTARTLALQGPRKKGPGARWTLYTTALNHGAYGLVPFMLTGFVLYVSIKSHVFAVDFHAGHWPAGWRLLHGLSPYLGPHSVAVLQTGVSVPTVEPFAYPSVGALLYAGFALLPRDAADPLFTALAMAAAALSLRLMSIRDWRLYGLIFLWPPVILGWQTANLTLLLGVLAAAVWYYRDRPRVSGPLLALAISLKVILWPLALWLLAVRRYRILGYAFVSGLAMNLVAWAVVGYNELPKYLSLMRASTQAGERRAYSVINLALHLGASTRLATAIGYGVAAVAAFLCFKIGRSGRERAAFALSVGVVLLATPVIWLHYFALLLVPLALIEPRARLLWLLPLLTFGCPPTVPSTWQITLVLAIFFALTVLMLRTELRSEGVTVRDPEPFARPAVRTASGN